MSKEWHPDKHKGEKDAEQKFKEINEAYEVLSDPQKRQMYDQFGEAGANMGGGGGGGFGGFDFSQFQGFQGGQFNMGDLFENFFGGARGQKRSRDRGDDREVEVAIDFMQSVTGMQQTINLKKMVRCEECGGSGAEKGGKLVTCGTCGGTGQVVQTVNSIFGRIQQQTVCTKCTGSGKIPETPCKRCSGEGRYRGTEDITISIPAGIADGQTLKVEGRGDAGLRNGPAGDLYVHIAVRPDPRFERDGNDIRSQTAIHALDAILGRELEVETVHGPMTLQIPEGMQPGQVFRLKGKGMPILNSSRTGDHYVQVDVEIPRKLSREERKLAEEWRGMKK